MELYKMSFALISLTAGISLALIHSIHAQDSPQDYLDAHNAARAAVGVAPLTWDDQVARFAQDYANTHVGDCQLVHSGGQYGENLAMSTGDLSGTDAVNLWIREKADYDYNLNTCAAGKGFPSGFPPFLHHSSAGDAVSSPGVIPDLPQQCWNEEEDRRDRDRRSTMISREVLHRPPIAISPTFFFIPTLSREV
ncbi:hypothetical protein ACLB2K_020950 [Fragaria x ananassa]